MQAKYITFLSNKKKIVLSTNSILYVVMIQKNAEIHVSGGKIYETRMTISELEEALGEGFIKVHRGCLVSAMAIHDITDFINLSNGESLEYTVRKKKQIIEQFHTRQRSIINSFDSEDIPTTVEEYRTYYSSFEKMPFAFTDIEMIFNEEQHAVDWIFRYGNPALAEIENMPLEQLIGNTFGTIFSNMDVKWLRTYERATLYGEMLEMLEFSPEINKILKVICFPTFQGHCGCILFDAATQLKFTKNNGDMSQALMFYMCN